MRDTDVERMKTTYYYPLTPPSDLPPNHAISPAHHIYDPLHLPNRTNAGFMADAKSAESDDTGATAKETGIKSSSILFRIPSIRFPYSFPIDVMHLIYLGLTRDLVMLLNGSYFAAAGKARDTSPPYALPEKLWREIGQEMGNARIPTCYGRQTRNIDKYMKSFKSEECATFLHNIMLHLLNGRVSPEVYTMLVRLVLAISLAITFTVGDIDEIRVLLKDFALDFYRIFYAKKYENLRVCKYTIHSVLHIADCVQWWGSAANFWQYPEERFCGMLVAVVKSRVHGSTNLSILMYQQQLLHLAFAFRWIPGDEGQFQDSPTLDEEEGEETRSSAMTSIPRILSTPESDHEFMTPRRRKELSATEIRHLRKHYVTRYSLDPDVGSTKEKLANMSTSGVVWGRCRDNSCNTTYSSIYAQRKRLGGRLNSFACLEQEVDVNARFRQETRGEEMVPTEFYGDIQYFLLHVFDKVSHALVYVHYVHHRIIDGTVQDCGAWVHEYTGVECLKRLVGRVTIGARPPKTYVVEEVCDSMIQRLRDVLL
jgi:hypothetical protein